MCGKSTLKSRECNSVEIRQEMEFIIQTYSLSCSVLFLSLAYLCFFPSPASVLSPDKKMLQNNRISSVNHVSCIPHVMQNLNYANRVEYFIISMYLNNTSQKLSFLSQLLYMGMNLIRLHDKSTPFRVQHLSLLIPLAKKQVTYLCFSISNHFALTAIGGFFYFPEENVLL